MYESIGFLAMEWARLVHVDREVALEERFHLADDSIPAERIVF
jgi:hypothetical protein